MALGKALCLRVPYAVRGCLGYCLAGASRRGGVIGQNPACSRLLYASKALWGEEKVTHTGQKWEKDDYRRVRFIDKEKQINEQFAIDLLAEEPVVCAKETHVWCDGGRGALGHPRVYINLDKPEINDCGYCGKRFLAEKHKTMFPNEKFEDLKQ